MIDKRIPSRSAVILTQVGLPDPLDQALNHKPGFDGRLSVRKIQRGWVLKAGLVTLSACDTAWAAMLAARGSSGLPRRC